MEPEMMMRRSPSITRARSLYATLVPLTPTAATAARSSHRQRQCMVIDVERKGSSWSREDRVLGMEVAGDVMYLYRSRTVEYTQ
jgi:hypothetical protein